MCGRFTISKEKEDVVKFLNDYFQVTIPGDFDLPRYNVSPGQKILAVLFDGENHRAGLIPWDYKINHHGRYKQMINARSESVDGLYAFKKAFKSKRCLIVADGFYEWDQSSKQPYRIEKHNQGLYFYAGIYDGKVIGGKKHFGALILTTEANPLIKKHHPRMPVMLEGQMAKQYLNDSLSAEAVKLLLHPYPEEKMTIYPVSKDVNNGKNDTSDLIKKTTNN
ncbi:MAG TPA: SOS response-associated peptidase [Candidatus Izemoplasmatales bacterium]|nr:SOS response-associated peptidase [Candidatus Izemoplasmatales bacterium]